MHHNEVPFNSKGKALLSGMVYCAHCGSKLVLTTSSGRRAKGEPKRETHIRYACHYKIRHPQDCDGQTGYSGEKLDGIIDKIVIQLFERMKTAPRKMCIRDRLSWQRLSSMFSMIRWRMGSYSSARIKERRAWRLMLAERSKAT